MAERRDLSATYKSLCPVMGGVPRDSAVNVCQEISFMTMVPGWACPPQMAIVYKVVGLAGCDLSLSSAILYEILHGRMDVWS